MCCLKKLPEDLIYQLRSTSFKISERNTKLYSNYSRTDTRFSRIFDAILVRHGTTSKFYHTSKSYHTCLIYILNVQYMAMFSTWQGYHDLCGGIT